MTWRRMSQKTVSNTPLSECIQNKKLFEYFEPLLIGLTHSGLEFTPLFCSLFMERTLSQNTLLKVEKNWRKICADMLRRQE